MILVQIAEFILIAVLYILNLNHILSLLSKKRKFNKIYYLLYIPYLASCLLLFWSNEIVNPLISLCAGSCFYLLLYLLVVLHSKCNKIIIAYITMLFLSMDSIFQSRSCIVLNFFNFKFNQIIVWNTTSIIFNIISFVLIRSVLSKNRNQIRNSIKLLSKKIYILILISIFVIGQLCGNLAQASDAPIRNDVHSLFTTLTVLIFLIVIIWFVFSSISKQYYESVSKVMEKQVDEQVSYYQKINKLSEDIREFRHDYKNHMICLQALLEGKEYADALEYVRDITRQDIIESNKFFSGNQIADAILCDKAELAKQSGCKIEFDGFISDEIPAPDLCIILSNALDNAIEACARLTSNGDKIITVKCDIMQNVQLMRITNPNDINNSTTETSKEDKENHDFGLYNIRRTVERHNGQMSIPSKTPQFVLELEFQIK